MKILHLSFLQYIYIHALKISSSVVCSYSYCLQEKLYLQAFSVNSTKIMQFATIANLLDDIYVFVVGFLYECHFSYSYHLNGGGVI